ncbi:MAG: fibrillarin-like rRNA/tRNA 2'-O-methyltransferase [Candidatus Micrarchaeota archaeon]|nr:fibrillarin-like rRNA/tRNA 2'-O-methyltransferase [Candidatus Micrarchaeota archaeon]MDE1833540.1 fibrillarin-like rRNA/tRNA 2'-O-methyltransferase [Candidatus Micrarchaeota archaeon]
MAVKRLFENVYLIDGKLATPNLKRGKRVYNEELVQVDSTEYRLWNPYRSKLAAAILNGMKNMSIKEGSDVLYVGAATGTTVSHVSDIVKGGSVFAVELAERNMRNLLELCDARDNIMPILSDARQTENYESVVGKVDVMYQDVSAKEQAAILLANSRFLKEGGIAYFIIKSQSVDISKRPKEVYEQELKLLEGAFKIEERISLEPYDSMHLFAVLRKV